MTTETTEALQKEAELLAHDARYDFCNPRADAVLPSLTAIELRVGRRIADALIRAYNSGRDSKPNIQGVIPS